MTKIRVRAAIVDTERLTLYREDGTTYEIQQGDPRIRPILDVVTPILARRDGSIAEVDLGVLEANDYKDFQDKSSGIVKFFRVAKKFVQHIFAEPAEFVEPQQLGTVPGTNEEKTEEAPVELTNAIDEIMANAKPIDGDDFVPSQKSEDETIIAVVEDKIIPGMENLKGQFAYASKLGSTIGVENFLKRLTTVIDKRGHSVDDLLRFMEKGDLPIADDGCIIAYKRLKTKGSDSTIYVDCHSGNVKQRVGSYVVMDEKMVDPNRRRDCSNGLHIARRGYLRSFTGNILVLCKIAPEDVIAVPQYDPNKVRVCAYHIIALVPESEAQKLISNRAMTDSENGQTLLGKAIKGQHIGKIEEVRITQSYGGGLKITQLAGGQKPKIDKKAEPVKATAIFDKEDDKLSAPTVDPKAVAQEAQKASTLSPKEQARELFNKKDFATLTAFKKQRKVGWAKLGFTDAEVTQILGDAVKPKTESHAEPVKKKVKPATKITKGLKEAKNHAKGKPNKGTKTKEIKVENTNTYTPEKKLEEMNREEKARHHFRTATENKDKSGWTALWLLKKQAKKSFTQLGFNSKEVERIETNKPDHV